MPSEQYAKKRDDPKHLHFIIPKPQGTLKHEPPQDVPYFCKNGYTSLVESSPVYGCLISACQDILTVFPSDALFSLVNEGDDRQKVTIKLDGTIKFL